ncbi:MAG TPA: CocE/NonD family hydrolase [Conexibacter sp.]
MSDGKDGVGVEFDVPAAMRDGVTLRANVYRPEGSGPWPTLLMRTPYGKDSLGITHFGLDPVQVARRGFVVVVQDTRGRFASDGEWAPFRFERLDGYDSVEWAARLPESSGRVGMCGGSYFGNTQWLAALERPPSLGAIAPTMTWSDPMDGLFGRGGAVELGVDLWWSLLINAASLERLGLSGEELGRRADALLADFDRLDEDGYWALPVGDGEVLRRHGVGDVDLGGISVLADPEVAERCRVAGAHHRVEVPSFHVAGWYDNALQGTLDNYATMTALGREARLVAGPWTHLTFADPIGDRVFGVRATRDELPVHAGRDLAGLQLAWFRRQLEGDEDVELPETPVRIFVMGRNEWRDEPSWPLERAVEEQWFLRAGGSVTAEGPGVGERPSEFAYDPADPVPTVGGHAVMTAAHPPGPRDQAAVEAREDVLVFTSDPLQEDVEVTGRVRVVLHAESSAPSTDWVARLCDVHPDGRSINLCDGILRVEQDAQACRRYEIDLWSTSNVFLRGHQLRVHVTSSSFPRWDRNLNTGKQHERTYEVARQRIHHDTDRPSCVVLPVVR